MSVCMHSRARTHRSSLDSYFGHQIWWFATIRMQVDIVAACHAAKLCRANQAKCCWQRLMEFHYTIFFVCLSLCIPLRSPNGGDAGFHNRRWYRIASLQDRFCIDADGYILCVSCFIFLFPLYLYMRCAY